MTPDSDIAHWRSEIISRMIAIVLVLGIITAVPSIVLAVRNDMWPMIAVDIVALAWLGALWRMRRLSYRARVVNFIAIVFFASIGLMINVGYVAQVFLMAPSVFAVVLLGMRPALVAVAGSGLVILVLGLTGLARPELAGFPPDGFVATILATLNFLFIGTMITVCCGTLLQKVTKSLADLQQFAASLEEGKNALHAANAELRLTAAAVAQLNDRVIIARASTDPARPQPIIFANDAFLRGTGFTREEVLGRSMTMFSGPETDPVEAARIASHMARGEGLSSELQIHAKSGAAHWVELDISPFRDETGAHTHWVIVGRDISERKKAANAIHQLAYYDVLTGLPNRRRLMEQLNIRLAQAGSAHGALLFIDLDHFKYVNDARGHATGDDLLRNTAQVISSLVRGDDMAARLGGDEFVVLLTGIAGDDAAVAAAATARAQAIGMALAREVAIDSQHYSTSASIGIALLRPGQSADDLLREADTAMYRAKANGRNGVALFESTMRAEMEERLTLERDLANGFRRGELSMHLQLQFDADARPAGAEMLMRWRRADGRMVPPDVFIPLAETTGLIVQLGEWALRQACLAWQQLAALGHAMPLSVNVSPTQFRQADFVATVQRQLAETGMPPDQLILEVTEGIVVGDRDGTIARMQELAGMGVRFSIDDFGTGYSNLAYLKRMPLYELKIDKSFIHETPGDADGTAIVRSILAMAAQLRLRVVAEGVESQEQARYLTANGAPHMQGFLFARPKPLADVLAELARLGEAVPDEAGR
ncbi:putative bifunctional diguanylate cyclase/phosphodiesterase [Pseudoduganella albidiflava]|uniref:EAL domain-containing protein n=2 Tax=Pseudoduganella albidiflava TaxID=321983 RepID=A0AA87Y1A8_9BURK|nr:GGDEF domain-containing phosphodiesterase [Pseudoduganella albidiflava]GGY61627.1 hypothetical protein GCM10007387_50240 [Pseudoduganella albidiflava]